MCESEYDNLVRRGPIDDCKWKISDEHTSRRSSTVIGSEREAQANWISSAVPPEEFKKILAQTSFDSEVLVAFAMGERETATGRIYVTDVSYNAFLNSFSAQGYVGVNEACHRI